MTTSLEAAEPLPPEYEIALSYTPSSVRDAARSYLSLDRRLAQIVAQTNEPMLGQMRLAWWRDVFETPIAERPRGDLVLEAIGQQWAGHEQPLIAMVDAWEEMLAEPPLPREAALHFAKGRAAGFLALAQMVLPELDVVKFMHAGYAWALTDAAAHIPDGEERDMLLSSARSFSPLPRYPKPMRGVAILDALARRAIAKGGRPLMEGRGAALTAFKTGLLG
ncbi:MAG: squalene/phytoene synthase family protein [Erythrobacter sp.]